MEILGYTLIVIGFLFWFFVLGIGIYVLEQTLQGRQAIIYGAVMIACTISIVIGFALLPEKQTATIELSNNTIIQCHDLDLGE